MKRYRRFPEKQKSIYVRIRMAIEELGPTFIKFGQIMSTREDLFPPGLIEELKKLQDQVPPVPFSKLRPKIQDRCEVFEECFQNIDEKPLAAASLAQVHRARLKDGTEVVLKIKRPEIDALIETDIVILRSLAERIEKTFPESKVYNPIGLVQDFAEQIRKELDFTKDGKNGERFAYNFSGWPGIKFPKIFWEHTGRNLLVMEYIQGVRIDQKEEIKRMGVNPVVIAERGFNAYMKQIFKDGFFHGDPHFGNLLITPQGNLAFLDFGIVGVLRPEKQQVYINLLRSIETNNINLLYQTLKDLGTDIKPEYEDRLKDDLYILLADYNEIRLREFNFSTMVEDLTAVLRKYQLQVPMNMMLMLKVIMEVASVGVALDPNFNFSLHSRDYLDRLSREKTTEKVINDTIQSIADTLEGVVGLPSSLDRALQTFSSGSIKMEIGDLDRFRLAIHKSTDKITVGIIIAALVIGSSIVLLASGLTLPSSIFYLALVGYTAAVLMGMYELYYAVFFRGKKR
ncbi:MAG: AarF/UbiB family protein [Methanomicrobiales archaeon]|nr:AarF/UbiB family protein [Methanomicrobiales archaeon]